MCSYEDVTQLVLFLLAGPRCHNVTDEQKEPDRRKKIKSKERNGREGRRRKVEKKTHPYNSGKQAKKKKEKADGDEQIERKNREDKTCKATEN